MKSKIKFKWIKEIYGIFSLYVFVIVFGLTEKASTESLTYEASSGKSCKVSVPEGTSLNIVCRHKDVDPLRSLHTTCHLKHTAWQYIGMNIFYDISNNDRYGVLDNVPGLTSVQGEHISILHLYKVRAKELGLYRCESTCIDSDGAVYQDHHIIELCITIKLSQFSMCAAPQVTGHCTMSFWNEVCNLDCDNERSLFDGYDCISRLDKCNPLAEKFCVSNHGDGICDDACDNAECGWDGGDCVKSPLKWINGTLAISTGSMVKQPYPITMKDLERSFSRLTRTIVKVFPSDWVHNHIKNKKDNHQVSDLISRNDILYQGTTVYLRIAKSFCKKKCFRKIERVAQFIVNALKSGWDPGISIEMVSIIYTNNYQCHKVTDSDLKIDLALLEQYSSFPNNSAKQTQLNYHILIAMFAGGAGVILIVLILTVIICRVKRRNVRRKQMQEMLKKDIPMKDNYKNYGVQV